MRYPVVDGLKCSRSMTALSALVAAKQLTQNQLNRRAVKICGSARNLGLQVIMHSLFFQKRCMRREFSGKPLL